MSPFSFARRFRSEVGDAYVVGLARVVLGVLLFWQALDAGRELLTLGYFGAAFHLPFVPEAFVPRREIYAGLLAVRLAAATLATVGIRARLALFVAATLGLYALGCDRLHYDDAEYALLCVALVVSFAPCDRAWLILGPTPAPGRRAPLWAARLAQLHLSMVYLASGASKLQDEDWRGGRVLADAVTRSAHVAVGSGAVHAVVDRLAHLSLLSGISKVAMATELFLGVGLWLRRTRIFALWWGVWFHAIVEVTSRMHLMTSLALTLYLLFATPDTLARKLHFDPSRRKGVILARLVSSLDWLARFDVRPWTPDGRRGHTIVVTRRDGSRATGIRAFAMVARCVPLLFPLWGPLAIVASFTKGGEASPRA